MIGSLFLLAIQLAAAVSVTLENHWFLVPAALLPVLLVDARLFRILTRWKLLAFLGVMVGGFALLLGPRDAAFLGIPYTPEYVGIGIVMAERSIIILLALRTFTTRLPLESLATRVRQTRFRRLGEAFSLAMRLLPPVRAVAAESYRAYRLDLTPRNAIPHTATWMTELLARVLLYAERHSNDTEESNA